MRWTGSPFDQMGIPAELRSSSKTTSSSSLLKVVSWSKMMVDGKAASRQALAALLSDVPKEHRLGGEVFVVGRYFSANYAETICASYRKAGFLTVTEQRSEPGKSRA